MKILRLIFVYLHQYFIFIGLKIPFLFPGKLDDAKKELEQLNKQKEEALKS